MQLQLQGEFYIVCCVRFILRETNVFVLISALTSMHMHLRARYFVITSKSTWTSTIALMARVYGFATSDVFVIDIESETSANALSILAKIGCSKLY